MRRTFILSTLPAIALVAGMAYGNRLLAQKAAAKVAAPKPDVQADAAAPTPIDQSLTFTETLATAVAVGAPDITATEAASLQSFLSLGEDHHRVKLLKWAIVSKAIRHGVLPAGTDVGSVNWQALLAFIQGIMPLILMLVKLFGGP